MPRLLPYLSVFLAFTAVATGEIRTGRSNDTFYEIAPSTETAGAAIQATTPVTAPPRSDAFLVDGERLRYLIKWTGLPAGEMIMEVHAKEENGLQGFEITLKTRSSKALFFYSVHDEVSSFVEAGNFRASRFVKHIRQGRRVIDETSMMDYAKGEASFEQHNIGKKKEPERRTLKIAEPALLDPLSVFFYLRAANLGSEKSEELHIFDRGKTYALSFAVLDDEALETDSFGERPTLHIAPAAAFEGVLLSAGEVNMWLDKSTRIPLRIKIQIPVGWAVADLVESNHPGLQPPAKEAKEGRRHR